MAQNEIQELLDQFREGNGFGDPDARLNAEHRLQVLLASGRRVPRHRRLLRRPAATWLGGHPPVHPL